MYTHIVKEPGIFTNPQSLVWHDDTCLGYHIAGNELDLVFIISNYNGIFKIYYDTGGDYATGYEDEPYQGELYEQYPRNGGSRYKDSEVATLEEAKARCEQINLIAISESLRTLVCKQFNELEELEGKLREYNILTDQE